MAQQTESSESGIERTLGRLEAALDGLTREVRTANDMNTGTITKVANRVDKLERWRVYLIAYASGVLATVVIIAGLFWRVVGLLK